LERENTSADAAEGTKRLTSAGELRLQNREYWERKTNELNAGEIKNDSECEGMHEIYRNYKYDDGIMRRLGGL